MTTRPMGPRVAIAHDYLTQRGGAERVVLAMTRAFPEATIYTTLYDPDRTYPEFRDARIVTSPLNHVGFFRRHHRAALPLLPFAAEFMKVPADVVLVSSSGWAHGFRSDGKRVVYCYSPARWLYQTTTYLGRRPSLSAVGVALLTIRPFLRLWDRRAAAQGHRYLAISRVVQGRIRDTYRRDAPVVAAPHTMDTAARQSPIPELEGWCEEGYHLLVSRLLPYKNVEKAIRAFSGLPERLLIIGSGPRAEALRALAGPNVRFASNLGDEHLRWAYAHATTVIAPSFEDFGLTPLEAASFGVPSLTLRDGGYLDTVREGVTGLHFDSPSPRAIREAVIAARSHTWDREAIREHAATFSEDAFARRLRAEVDAILGLGAPVDQFPAPVGAPVGSPVGAPAGSLAPVWPAPTPHEQLTPSGVH